MNRPLTFVLEAAGPFEPSAMSLADAKAEQRAFYVGENGYASAPKLLTPPEAQYKLGKSVRPTFGLSLAAADMSGYDVCAWRTPGCTAACVLVTAGKGLFPSVRKARVVKTRFLAEHPQAFVTLLYAELVEAARTRGGIDFRPNVASDIRWESVAPAILSVPGVRVYDYTKAPAAQRGPTDNYRLTFSVSERDASVGQALKYLQTGGTAAVVFDTVKGHALPATWNGFDVIDGDLGDSRVDDPAGVVVGLRGKGAARNGGDSTGFVKEGVAS
jgi:hypothetical protein